MNFAYIPSPTISEFQIGPVTIHIYALTMLLGITAFSSKAIPNNKYGHNAYHIAGKAVGKGANIVHSYQLGHKSDTPNKSCQQQT